MKTLFKNFKLLALLIGAVLFVQSCTEDDDANMSQGDLVAEFTYSIVESNGVVTFVNTSENATMYHWDLGDGTTSDEVNPSHVYGSGTYTVVLTASNAAGATDTYSDTFTIQLPNEPPVITLLGDAVMTVDQGTTFTDPGATATDPEDGDITSSIVVGGSVDTGTVGSYVLTYDVTDSQGTAANQVTRTVNVVEGFEGGLISNGGFEGGAEPWVGAEGNIQNDGTNSYFFVNVENAGNPWDVNLSQVLEITQGCQYTLHFDAWSNTDRSIIAGIGLNEAPWNSATETVSLTTSMQSFTLTLVASDFGIPNSRVLFDMGADAGEVYIDNVALFENCDGDTTPPTITLVGDATITLTQGDTFTDPGATATDDFDGDISANIVVGGDTVDTNTPGTYVITYDVSDAAGNAAAQVTRTVIVEAGVFDDGLLTNGDFENGAEAWTNGSIANDGTNSYFSINVENAGNPWDVNLSQILELTEGESYTLKFQAWSDAPRTLIAGIGLNEDPWTNVTETANLTTDVQDFEYTFTANFGSANSRVIFDMGHETGMVNIDNVALFHNGGGGGGGTNGCTGDLVAATTFPVDFEGCETFTSSFGDHISADIDVNPSTTGNPSSYAFKVEKPLGSEFWEGVQENFPNNFPDMTQNSFRLKIYSSKPNTTFRFEVAQDDPNVGNPPGAFATVADANTWTEVVVTFTSVPAPNAYFRFVIKPDNDQTDSPITEGGTYYFDDIEIIPTP